MIILRQRLYTRQDKKVIHELWSATKGFRQLPEGFKGMSGRDIFRFNNFAKGFNKAWTEGNIEAIDWNEAKTMLEHMNLSESAKGAKHLINKYSNPELLKRYKSIKAHKLGVADKYKELNSLREKQNNIVEKYNKAVGEATSGRGVSKEGEKSIADFENFIESKEKAKLDRLEKQLQKATGITGKPTSFEKKQRKLHKKALKESRVLEKQDKNDKLYKEILEKYRKKGYTIIPKSELAKERGTSFISGKEIHLSSNKSPSTLAHELGHSLYEKSTQPIHEIGANSSGFAGIDPNPLAVVSDETGATKKGLALTRIMENATEKDIERGSKHLEAAGKTYYHDMIGGFPGRIRERLKL